MGAVVVQRTLASAIRVFHADRVRAAAPLRADGAKHIAKRFDPIDVGIQAGDRPLWVARKGACRFGDRRIAIEEMHGNENELGVTVDGSTGDAIDVLRELWTHLGAFDDAGETALDEAPGLTTWSTTMVFSSSKHYADVLPFVAAARQQIARVLAVPSLNDGEPFKVEIPFTLSISGVTTTQSFSIERRFTARADDRVYWSRSPLNSEDHLALLETLFR